MAAKKTTTQDSLIKAFMQYVLENDCNPKNVYLFAKDQKITEAEFYKYFSSFEAMEKEVFNQFFMETVKLLNKDESYKEFNAKDKLLSFYFTFFAILTQNRSYVVYAISKDSNKLITLRKLTGLKELYTDYVQSLEINTPSLDIEQLEKFNEMKEKGMKEMSFNQLLFTLKFWLNDTSPSFEKTDIFIEKSINTGFEIIEKSPIKSIIDLGKFLMKEKSVFKL